MKQIYALRDTLAGSIVGGLFLHPHDAPAIRFFGDVASDQQTMIARHINEHELIMLGTLDEETGDIAPEVPVRLVITGAAWKAAQQLPTEP